jgi:hypothetical protein
MYASLGQRLFIGAAVVLLTTINVHAPARAQTLSSDPIRIDDDPKPPPAPRNECTAKHKVSVDVRNTTDEMKDAQRTLGRGKS